MRRPSQYPNPRYNDPEDLRLLSIIRKGKHKAKGAVNIMGVPYDGAVLGRRGAAEGPSAVRLAMSAFSNYSIELNTSLEEARIVDLGDFVPGSEDVVKVHEEVEKEVALELDPTSVLAILGGDNSLSLPALRAYEAMFGEIGLVVLDSHMDLRGEIGGRPTSGSSYGVAISSLGGLDPRRVAEIGMHGFLNSRKYVRKAEKLGLRVFTAKEVRDKGAERVAREAFEVASKGSKAVYLSVDLDAVDLGSVSGVSAPSAGGMQSQELFDMMYHFGGRQKVKCMDLLELAPGLDPTGRSQIVAATALVYFVAGFTRR